jgi:hypothetical protein
MNYLFSPYIGRFMDVYLDDIIIYSNSLKEHIEHVKTILDILKREKLYLSEKKLNFLCEVIKILGRVIDANGIRMDPEKVDAISKWKVPTNRDLLRGFLGAAGYLADDIDRVRIPMGILHHLTSDSVPWRWDEIHQRAFDEVKERATRCKDHHRRPLTYEKNAQPVNMVTDGCITGIAGVISQGDNWKTAAVAAFYSAKLSPAQQNYPVHEIEFLAGVETMLRHRDILQGVHFRWYTDHKGLEHLLNQKGLSGRQARWMEKIGEFDFEIIYVPGTENILSDALSRLYSNEAKGTIRTKGEYTAHDEGINGKQKEGISSPVYVGEEARALESSAVTIHNRGESIPHVVSCSKEKIIVARPGQPNMIIRGPRERPERGDKGETPQKVTSRSGPPEEDEQVNELVQVLNRASKGPDELAPPISVTKIMKGVNILEEIGHK